MEEKYQKFIEYNWDSSEEWHSYFRNIFPTPPDNKILRYKKKFYRNKIDPDFDINYKSPNYEEEEKSKIPNSNSNDNSSSTFTSKINISDNKTPILNVETILMILFFFSLPIKYNSKLIAIIIFLIRSIRQVGNPKFDKSYLFELLKNESFQTLIYLVQLLIDRFNYFLMIPVIISIIISICENIKLYNFNFEFLKKITDVIINKKEDLLQDKSDIEVGLGFFLLLGFFLKINSLILFIVHIQILYLKYIIDFRLQRSLNKLNTYINQIKNNSKCPNIIKNIIQKIQNIFEYFKVQQMRTG